jgi:predicted acetyltransferase
VVLIKNKFMELILPSVKYKESYLGALEEAKTDPGNQIAKLQEPKENESFESFVEHFYDEMKGLNLPEGYVPATMFWSIDNGEFIGRVQVRHKLIKSKRTGHIGYYIRPSKRKMGYGKKMLEMALVEAGKIGFENVLLTCDDDNTGSIRIIENNGGILENIIEGEKEGEKKKRRYWIIIKK